MNKTQLSRTLFVAGALVLAGTAAQADAIFYPDGTMVELGENGAEQLALDSPPGMVDTTVLGGPAAVTTTTTATTVPASAYVYVQPNIHFDRSTVVSQMQHRDVVLNHRHVAHERQSAATFNVPARAGEASTMTGGAPNMVTHNDTYVVGSVAVPYGAITVGQPYYVLSY
jgi:hypothetical protein